MTLVFIYTYLAIYQQDDIQGTSDDSQGSIKQSGPECGGWALPTQWRLSCFVKRKTWYSPIVCAMLKSTTLLRVNSAFRKFYNLAATKRKVCCHYKPLHTFPLAVAIFLCVCLICSRSWICMTYLPLDNQQQPTTLNQ